MNDYTQIKQKWEKREREAMRSIIKQMRDADRKRHVDVFEVLTDWSIIAVIVTGLMLIVGIASVSADQIDDKMAIRCIIGEASGEGILGMTAVAEAIRNRGTLKGVYGCRAKHVDREPNYVWVMAADAWEKSKSTNLTDGADHWESIDFKTPYWARRMTMTAMINKHVFYRSEKQ